MVCYHKQVREVKGAVTVFIEIRCVEPLSLFEPGALELQSTVCLNIIRTNKAN